ncbi:hypothetical protein BDR06DRAFT_612686 [Suillus hirtellus]|nr:hypothetical protein BDR06DRAFT_612686 [Suillus hirtellus]
MFYFFLTKSLTTLLTFSTANQIHNPFPSPDAGFKPTDLLSNKGLVKPRVLGLGEQNVHACKYKYIITVIIQFTTESLYMQPANGLDLDHGPLYQTYVSLLYSFSY